jgi:hypothetical protein
MVKHIIFGFLSLLVSGCISVGSHRVSVPTPATVGSDDDRIVLIVIDGLNHDALKRYLKRLSDIDHEPNWQSGLSLLARQEFKLANAQYPMTALPAFSPTAEATMMTGQPPIVHGIFSSRFGRLPAGAPPQVVDLRAPAFQKQFLLDKQQQMPTHRDPSMGALLLDVKPWLVALHQHQSSSSVFLPFAQGSDWYIPALTQSLNLAFFNNTVSKQITLLLDQKIEDIAEDVIGKGAHLTSIRFTGVRGHSCAPSRPGCRDASKSLKVLQQEALTRIDKRLWNLFRNFQMRHPEAFEKTVFLISGTVGTTLRPTETIGNPAFTLKVSEIEVALKAQEDDACNQSGTTPLNLHHQVWADSGFAMIQVPGPIQGQRVRHDAQSRCVVKNLQRLVKQLEAQGQLDAAVWHEPGARNAHVHFSPAYMTQSGSLERRRISDKLKTMTRTTEHGQTIGALFLSPPFIFSVSDQERVHRGNLRQQTIRFPFLIADKRLSQTARRQMEGATIDQIDFGPTIFGLLNQRVPAELNFPRKPLLEFSESDAADTRVLNYSRQHRNVYGSPKSASPIDLVETEQGVTLTYREDRSVWPPDKLTLTFGPVTAVWSIESQSFDRESCIFTHDEKKGRTWQCSLPFPKDTHAPSTVLERTPDINGVGSSSISTQLYREPKPSVITTARRVCGDTVTGSLILEAGAEDGLNSLTFQAARTLHLKDPLTPFNVVNWPHEKLVERICPKDNTESEVCRFNAQGHLTGIKGTFALNSLYDRNTAPEALSICARSGLCTRTHLNTTAPICP